MSAGRAEEEPVLRGRDADQRGWTRQPGQLGLVDWDPSPETVGVPAGRAGGTVLLAPGSTRPESPQHQVHPPHRPVPGDAGVVSLWLRLVGVGCKLLTWSPCRPRRGTSDAHSRAANLPRGWGPCQSFTASRGSPRNGDPGEPVGGGRYRPDGHPTRCHRRTRRVSRLGPSSRGASPTGRSALSSARDDSAVWAADVQLRPPQI